MKGFVYILSNPSMPGLLKVGRTARSVDGRAMELYQTGVPTPFLVEHSVFSPDCVALEADVHECMAEMRVGQGREFFRCKTGEAIQILDDALLGQMQGLVYEYLEGYDVVYQPFAIDPVDLDMLCQGTDDVHPFEVAQAISLIDPAAVQAAVNLKRERARLWREKRAASGEPF